MEFRNLDAEGWQRFAELTQEEGWLVSSTERSLFLTDCSAYAWELINNGRCCGFVTAVPYRRTGWIGNLIVPTALRGKGYGSVLFDFAVDQLQLSGVSSVWLTASEDGAPLYSSRGFRQVDTVERFKLKPSSEGQERTDAQRLDDNLTLTALDASIWNDNRSSLVQRVEAEGSIVAVGDSVAVLQQSGSFQMIGPWYAGRGDDQSLLLKQLLQRSDRSKPIVVDGIASSLNAQDLLTSGFVKTGSTRLMVKGDSPEDRYLPAELCALTSLGSIG